jgi:hypothetical protein
LLKNPPKPRKVSEIVVRGGLPQRESNFLEIRMKSRSAFG